MNAFPAWLRSTFPLLGLGAFLLAAGVARPAPGDYEASLAAQRAERVQRLTTADGWLTLIGLHWIEPGVSAVGAAADNRIVLAAGPAHFGTIERAADGSVRFTPAAGVAIEVDGQPVVAGAAVELRDDQTPGVRPTRVRAGSVSFHLLDRSGKKGLRVRDAEAAARREFLGIDVFATAPAWRVVARWVPFDAPRTQPIANILGDVEPEPVVGEAVFEHEGREVRLLPVWDGAPGGRLHFIISDATSGHETYAAARFVYAEPPRDGQVVIDFNLAVNPPCAFTPFATCPLPPKQNRLPFPVRAGEKRYRGEPAH